MILIITKMEEIKAWWDTYYAKRNRRCFRDRIKTVKIKSR